MRPYKNETYSIFDNIGIRYLTWLRIDLSPLNYYKHKHKFKDTASPTCMFNDGIEDTTHFLLDCLKYMNERDNLMRNISFLLDSDLINLSRDELVNLLLYGSNDYDYVTNKQILLETIKFIKSSKRFSSDT